MGGTDPRDIVATVMIKPKISILISCGFQRCALWGPNPCCLKQASDGKVIKAPERFSDMVKTVRKQLGLSRENLVEKLPDLSKSLFSDPMGRCPRILY